MAFGDFLNTGIGGTTPVNQQTTVAGTAGAPVGPTWGQALGSAMRYGSAPGSSAPMLGQAMQQQSATAPLASMAMPPSAAQKQASSAEDGDSLSQVLGVLLKLFGI